MAKRDGAKATVERGVFEEKVKTTHVAKYTNKVRKPPRRAIFDYRWNMAPEINLYGP